MPQASDELRAKWSREQGVGEDKALAFLEQKGWTQTSTGLMHLPQGKSKEDVSSDEWEALQFLIDEWDFAPSWWMEEK